ncbi:MAG: carbohydrate binding family 9 domain-containing protein [Gramella sp.]|nr:carbohydrate binding family 9 domain-containing protein [Christiangramia sp.]
MPIRFYILFFLLLNYHLTYSQSAQKERRSYTTQRIDNPPKIDGVINDEAWSLIDAQGEFVMVEPGDGDPIDSSHETRIKILYDNEAIYIAGIMLEEFPERIMKQFTQRDNLNQSEFFVVDINTYDDGENQTRFIVTAAGTQADARMTGNREDFGYNVVWESAVSEDDKGWYVEMKIPYAALRFPDKENQLWGVQFYRDIKHLNSRYVWNYIDKSLGQPSQYTGLLKGISDIDPPVRLSLYPYTSTILDQFDGNTDINFNAGLDLKYGINDSFTLDMTLVPDFGQVAFDQVELNLGPFEQIFGENRAFFTEGTELFNKGNLFYSRRVGSTPIGFNAAQADLLENEEILENPDRTDLLNALKISGRTERGLGIGFFNALTDTQEAIIQDTITGNRRKKITEPLANYNILVLDQRFNKNSSITLVNTNVTRDGSFRDGNVSAFLFDIFNKSNSFNFEGEAKMSNVNKPEQNETGFASELSVERTKGNLRYRLGHEFANETYDINDLGISFINNYNNFFWGGSYEIFEPKGNFNRFEVGIFGQHLRRYKPDVTVNTAAGGRFFAVTRNRFAYGGSIGYNSEFKDYFEPRADDTFILYDPFADISFFVSSDYRKRFAYDVRLNYDEYLDSSYSNLRLRLSPRFRFNEHFNMVYDFRYNFQNDRPSYVSVVDKEVIFGNRDQKSIENSINATYNFNNKQGLNLNFRHFWSTATFSEDQFTRLKENGDLEQIDYIISDENDPDANFNIWNLDLSYRWQFAPGSEAVLLYRNSIFNEDKLSQLGFTESLDNLFQRPARNNLSLRIVYFIDYNNVKNLFKG